MDKITEEIEKLLAKIKSNVMRGVIIVALVLGLILFCLYGIIYMIEAIFSVANKSGGEGNGAIGYSSIEYTDEDIQYLATVIMHERGEEGTDDQWSYVASVVLNRVLTGRYNGGNDNTIKGIILAPNQFTGAGSDERWHNQFNAIGNWMTTGHSGSTERPDETCERAVNLCYSVLENGDTTGTTSHPEGGSTGFAGASIVREWLAGSWAQEGWYGLFNDADENCKQVETNGEHWKNDGTYGSLSYMANKSDLEVLEAYRTSSGLVAITGGITTDAEAEELERALTEMLHTTIHSNYENQQGPFPEYWTPPKNYLQTFQCTWWANGRASQYLAQYGTKYKQYPTQRGNGSDYYQYNIDGGWFEYGQEPRPNSIVSWWGPKRPYGHVAYVEGVNTETQTVYYSHAGGHHAWYGVSSASIEGMKSIFGGICGYVYLDSPK